MNISEFLNNEYSDSALYMNFRAIASYIDGLKNSGRKCIYTIKKKNIKEQMKVSALASEIVKEGEYIHGDTSIQGVIVNLAQNFCGSNNLPLLKGIGAFGTRMCNEAAAARYIFARPEDYFSKIFKKEDDINLISQEFEGKDIEPVFYVPTVPMIFVNGSVGIGIGFKSVIFPRNMKHILKAIRCKLNNEKINKSAFVPYWNGFKGTITPVANENNKWEIKGVADINKDKVVITELPISYELTKYIKVLQSLKEKGIIQRYIDFSEDENYKFEVKLSADEAKKDKDAIMKDLGLIETEKEILVLIDENNAIREYENIEDIFNDFYNIKIKYLKKRILSEVKRLEAEELLLDETYKFIQEVIKGTVNMKLKKSEVEKALKTKGYVNIEKLISLPLYSITKDKAEEIKKKLQDKKKEVAAMKKEKPESLWQKDLDEFEAHFNKKSKGLIDKLESV